MKPHPTGIKVYILVADGTLINAGEVYTTGALVLPKGAMAFNLTLREDLRLPHAVQELTDVAACEEGHRFYHPIVWMMPVPPDDSEFDYEEGMDWKRSLGDMRRLLQLQRETENEF